MILYLDCSSGISGDMLVAALLSLAGATEERQDPLDKVVRPALGAAGIDKRMVSIKAVTRGGVEGLAFKVPEGPGFATFDELIMSMYASRLDQAVADGVAALSQRLAAAEREVHGQHGHDELDELGGLDTAVDLISAVTLIHYLAPERVMASPPELGGGLIETAHGELEVPAPAVAVLLRDLPTAPLDESGKLGELTTPTGAALLAHFVDEFGPQPAGPIAAVGRGAGTREVSGRPNVLRALFIEPAPQEETMDRDADREGREGAGGVWHTASGIAGGVRRGERDESSRAQPSEEYAAPAAAPVAEPEPVAEPAAEEVPEPVAEPDPFVEREPGPVSEEEPEPVSEEEPEPVTAEPEAPAAVTAEREPAFTAPADIEPSAAVAAEDDVATEESEIMPAVDHGPPDHVVLEANVDDMAPELLAHAADVIRGSGALDVWMTQALMKKGRPGVVLHVLVAGADQRRLADVVFAETTTFGLRVVPVGRLYAEERRETVKLGGLEIRVRLSLVDGRPATVSPEYEDCRRAADKLGRPAKVVYEAAQAAARARFSGS